MRRCTVAGCEKEAGSGKRTNRLGMCVMHYTRLHRHGDPLVTKRRVATIRYEIDGLTGCWIWSGKKDQGYGVVKVGGKRLRAHRWVYEQIVGPVPEGITLDHTCHNADPWCSGGVECRHRACVNPTHLIPATIAENTQRGQARKTQCKRGHEINDANSYVNAKGKRICRVCRRDRQASA